MLWLLHRLRFRLSHFKGKEEIHFPTGCLWSRERHNPSISNYGITSKKIPAITFCRALFETVHLNFVAVTKHSSFNKWGGARCRSWCLFELAGLLVVMIMNWALGAVSTRGRGRSGGSGVRCCVKQADGWPDTVLIMATLVCWEATLCSRSMKAEEWRIVMTRGARVPEQDLPLRMLQRANVRSLIGAPLRPSSNFQKFIRVKWSGDNARLKGAVFGFSKLGGRKNVSSVPRLPVNVKLVLNKCSLKLAASFQSLLVWTIKPLRTRTPCIQRGRYHHLCVFACKSLQDISICHPTPAATVRQ